MNTIARLLRRIRYFLRRRQLDHAMDEEMQFHIDKETEKNLRAGMPPREARRAAVVAFGGVDRHKEQTRTARGTLLLDNTRRDAALALRGVFRRPGFALVVVSTLALGIGANAAVFRFIDALQLRTLPVDNPEQLVVLELADMRRWEGRRTARYPVLSNPLWERLREAPDPFQGALAWANAEFQLESSGGPEVARGLFVSGEFFDVLGVMPLLGRTFLPTDDRRGCGLPGAVLSHGFWQRRFGGDPGVVGRTVALNAQEVPVVGVTPEGFSGVEVGRAFDIAVPICSHATLGGEEGWLENGMVWWLTVMGRIPRDRTLDAVNLQLEGASPSIFEATLPAGYPPDRVGNYLSHTLRAVSSAAGVSEVRERYARPLLILQIVTALVLLIACTNLTNLFLARGTTRQSEFGVRQALGASRGRLLGQLVVESSLFATVGAAAGVMLAVLLGPPLLVLVDPELSLSLPFDARLVAFVLLLAGLSCAVFGMIPAWLGSRPGEIGVAAVGSGRGTASLSGGVRLRQGLVVAQVALSFVLVLAAFLFTGTLRNLMVVDTGFDSEDVSVARVDFSTLDLTEVEEVSLRRDLIDRIGSIPGVTAAAEVRHVPLGGTGSGMNVRGVPTDAAGSFFVRFNAVTEEYLGTMGIPLLSGRGFGERGSLEDMVAIVNPTFARRLGIQGDPVGERFLAESSGRMVEIIGLVPDTKYFSLREEPLPIALLPKEFVPDPRSFTDFVLRSARPASDLAPALRSAISSLSSQIRLDVRPFDEGIRQSLARERLMAALSGFFGVLAVLVAGVGLYGVTSYLVTRRTTDIGVRMALGARPTQVLVMVLRQASTLVVVGLVAGSVLALAAGTTTRSLLFGLEPHDLGAFGLAGTVFSLVAAAACLVPASRAALLPPREALRDE